MIFKQETIQSWFSGVGSSINNEVIQPFSDATTVIDIYNKSIKNNTLTQEKWKDILSLCDDSLSSYLEIIKGQQASLSGYDVSLQGNIIGFKKVSSAITQYNALSASGTKEQNMFANAVSVTNGKLGTYLTGLNGAKASLGGYVISLVGATVKTVALKVATIAHNSAITWGTSLIEIRDASFVTQSVPLSYGASLCHTFGRLETLRDVSFVTVEFLACNAFCVNMFVRLGLNKNKICDILNLCESTHMSTHEASETQIK